MPFEKVTAKHVPIEYLSSSKYLHFFEKSKNRLSWCPKIFSRDEKIYIRHKLHSFFGDYSHLELNFERNRDQEWAIEAFGFKSFDDELESKTSIRRIISFL